MLMQDIMKEGVVKSSADMTIREAAKKITNNRVGCLVITNDQGTVQGILTKSDIVRSLAERKDIDRCNVTEIMGKNIKSCKPATNIHDGAKMMADNRVKRLLVLDEEGKLKGLVSISELAPCLNKEAEEISDLFWK